MWLLFLLMWCITLIDIHISKHPGNSEFNPTWSWCMIFFMCYWIWLANILLRIFTSLLIKDNGLWFSFFGPVFFWFGYQGDGDFTEWLWEHCFFFNLLEVFEKNQHNFFFTCLVEFPSEAIQSWTFVCKEFFF